MELNLTVLMLIASVLLITSVLASKVSRFGVPALLLFLAIGMLAGSDGPGGIAFDNPLTAQSIGIVALALILFAGGLDTQWQDVRPVWGAGVALATLGTLVTAGLVGLFAYTLLGIALKEALLLGAIVSSTDAAAVFSVLRSRNIHLPGRLRSLLELESGSNDPMAVFLTVAMITLIQNSSMSPADLLPMFIRQMSLGAAFGYGMGVVLRVAVNRLHLDYQGLYPALTLGLVLLTYSVTDSLAGNGFLAVYMAGLVMRSRNFIHKQSLVRFHDGLGWMMQIAMFLTLGLQVFPSRLMEVAGSGLAIATFLMCVARPSAVMATLLPTALTLRERMLVGWVGLRGAAPIVLATFPLVARVPNAQFIFDLIFFVVVTSALIQGTTVSWVARRLRLSAPTGTGGTVDPLDVVAAGDRDIVEFRVNTGAQAAGRRLLDLGLPHGALVVLIQRGDHSFVPTGGSHVQTGDRLLILADQSQRALLTAAFDV